MGQAETLELSYFGRVTDAYEKLLVDPESVVPNLGVEPESIDERDRVLMEQRIGAGRMSVENLAYLYSMAVQIAENISTSDQDKKAFITTMLLSVSHRFRLNLIAAGLDKPEAISQIKNAIKLIENDRELMDVLIDRAMDDAALNLLRGETRTRAGAAIN